MHCIYELGLELRGRIAGSQLLEARNGRNSLLVRHSVKITCSSLPLDNKSESTKTTNINNKFHLDSLVSFPPIQFLYICSRFRLICCEKHACMFSLISNKRSQSTLAFYVSHSLDNDVDASQKLHPFEICLEKNWNFFFPHDLTPLLIDKKKGKKMTHFLPTSGLPTAFV